MPDMPCFPPPRVKFQPEANRLVDAIDGRSARSSGVCLQGLKDYKKIRSSSSSSSCRSTAVDVSAWFRQAERGKGQVSRQIFVERRRTDKHRKLDRFSVCSPLVGCELVDLVPVQDGAVIFIHPNLAPSTTSTKREQTRRKKKRRQTSQIRRFEYFTDSQVRHPPLQSQVLELTATKVDCPTEMRWSLEVIGHDKNNKTARTPWIDVCPSTLENTDPRPTATAQKSHLPSK